MDSTNPIGKSVGGGKKRNRQLSREQGSQENASKSRKSIDQTNKRRQLKKIRSTEKDRRSACQSKSIQSRETSKSSPKGVINCLHLEFVLKTLRTLQKSTGSEWISVEKLSEAIRQVHTKWHASNDEAETLIQEFLVEGYFAGRCSTDNQGNWKYGKFEREQSSHTPAIEVFAAKTPITKPERKLNDEAKAQMLIDLFAHTAQRMPIRDSTRLEKKEEQRMGKETPQISSKTPIEEFARTAQYMKPRKEVLPVGKVDLKVGVHKDLADLAKEKVQVSVPTDTLTTAKLSSTKSSSPDKVDCPKCGEKMKSRHVEELDKIQLVRVIWALLKQDEKMFGYTHCLCDKCIGIKTKRKMLCRQEKHVSASSSAAALSSVSTQNESKATVSSVCSTKRDEHVKVILDQLRASGMLGRKAKADARAKALVGRPALTSSKEKSRSRKSRSKASSRSITFHYSSSDSLSRTRSTQTRTRSRSNDRKVKARLSKDKKHRRRRSTSSKHCEKNRK